jgi:hypothetical protein
MEEFSQSHRTFQVFCAKFWQNADQCKMLLDEAGVPTGFIDYDEPSIMRWFSIINEMIRLGDDSMMRFVAVLMSKYPDNTRLAAVCAPWTPVAPATIGDSGAVLVKKFETEPPVKTLVPLVTVPDFAGEASLVVPRVNTLWEAVAQFEKRFAELEAQVVTLQGGKR